MARSDNRRNLQNAVALVTGAGSGLGRAIVELLVAAGAKVFLLGRDTDKLRRLCDEVGQKTEVKFLSGDVGDAAFCEQALADCVASLGGLELLFNNAGIIYRAPAADTPDAAWRDTMRVNLDGVFWLSRGAVAHMRKQKSGAIVNISSTVGMVGAAGLAAYCASKGGVAQLTRAMALECAQDGITVNAVCPGAIESPMLFSGHRAGDSVTAVRKRNMAAIPQRRLATPAEVARAAIFLATEPHITGALLPVDGGYTAQ
ncbi:MAG: SDR family NAD(P)-dependent oxidoreductase [Gammaproteobacteria bacterium]